MKLKGKTEKSLIVVVVVVVKSSGKEIMNEE